MSCRRSSLSRRHLLVHGAMHAGRHGGMLLLASPVNRRPSAHTAIPTLHVELYLNLAPRTVHGFQILIICGELG